MNKNLEREALSQHAALLATKLYIPTARTDLVQRSRLTGRLNEGLQRKFTLFWIISLKKFFSASPSRCKTSCCKPRFSIA